MIYKTRLVLVLFLCYGLTGVLSAQDDMVTIQPTVVKSNLLKQKLFYFLVLLAENDDSRNVLANDDYFRKVSTDKIKEIQNGVETCGEDIQCHYSKFHWTSSEIQNIGERLKELATNNPKWSKEVSDHMRRSGKFANYSELTDSEKLATSWVDAAYGMNLIADTYAMGIPPRYAKIDSMRYDKHSSFYKRLIDINVNSIARSLEKESLFFEPSLQFSLNLLDDNNYLKAVLFEPLENGENSKTIDFINKIDWDSYDYSVILVPGYGPRIDGEKLSPLAKYRLALAAENYRQLKAPLIVVSGSSVSPFGTNFNEAFEMKEELMRTFNIPESSIIIEPHARHTTTNIRNTVRLIFDYKIPSSKRALLTTTKYQHDYILREQFSERCMSELGFLPFANLKNINNNDIEFTPLTVSSHINLKDPLDP